MSKMPELPLAIVRNPFEFHPEEVQQLLQPPALQHAPLPAEIRPDFMEPRPLPVNAARLEQLRQLRVIHPPEQENNDGAAERAPSPIERAAAFLDRVFQCFR